MEQMVPVLVQPDNQLTTQRPVTAAGSRNKKKSLTKLRNKTQNQTLNQRKVLKLFKEKSTDREVCAF